MRNNAGPCSADEYLARRLEQAGVRHYFGAPGDLNLVLLDRPLSKGRGCTPRPSASSTPR